MMKAFTNMSSTSNDVLPNPVLADKLISVIKRKFKDGDVTVSLKDPCANLRMALNVNGVDDMRPIANLAGSQVLAAGFREYGEGKTRVCLSLALVGIMVMAYLNIGNQTEFDKKSGIARINIRNPHMDCINLNCYYLHILGLSCSQLV